LKEKTEASSRYELEYLRTMFSIFVVESEKEDKQRKHDCQPATQIMESQPKICDSISVKELIMEISSCEQGRRGPRGDMWEGLGVGPLTKSSIIMMQRGTKS
jgi:hypothetical protein